MKKTEFYQIIEKYSKQKPILYQSVYSQILGSAKAGLLLSQIVSLWEDCGGAEFCKTDVSFCEESGMRQSEFRAAKEKIKKAGIISTSIKGLPAKTHYSVNGAKLLELLKNQIKNLS